MSGLDAPRPGYNSRRAQNWVPCLDRRQATDRRSGAARGGRRMTDAPPEPLAAAVSKPQVRQLDWFGLWVAATKLQATFRHMRLHMW